VKAITRSIFQYDPIQSSPPTDCTIEGALSLAMIAGPLPLFYFQRFFYSKEKQIHVH
jgi:hypothetical protein